MNIFLETAPAYWAAGIPVIPLMRNEKKPAISRWQLYADTMPTKDEQDVWLSQLPDSNIGLPMGPTAGFVGIDIDSEDEKIIAAIERLLPPTPWVRIGKKGSMRVYRFNNERTTRIKGSDGGMICEILSKGTQIVLPPSIHPDTGRPYVANCNLLDVVSIIPSLPPNIATLIRDALSAVGVESNTGDHKVMNFVPSGARDNAMTWYAGTLARAVMRGERTLLEALGEMEVWVGTFVEQLVGDPITAEKGKQKVIEFISKDIFSGKKALPPGWDDGLSDEDKKKLGEEFGEENQIRTSKEIISYLSAELGRTTDPMDDVFIGAVETTLGYMVRAGDTLSALDEERILRLIATQSSGTLTVAALKKQLAALRKGDIAGESHREIADAVLEQIQTYGVVRYHASQFWQWKGAHWAVMDEAFLLKIIAEDYGFYPVCRRYSDYVGVLKTMKELAQQELSNIEVKGLNFANGFLTAKGEMLAQQPDYGMTYILPYRYLPELAGHMPMFNQFLMDCWGDDPDFMDKVAALQEAVGVTLFGDATTYQRAFCLWGQPGSGKSRIVSLLQGLLPREAMSSVPPQDWGDKFLPANMFGKLLNFAGELSETKLIPSEAFKMIVVGEEITSQFKNQTPFSFNPTAANWFSTNHLPRTRDPSDGFTRRWLIFEFTKRVAPEKIIVDLEKIILSHEREAIVAWAVQGYQRLIANGVYTQPASHLAAQEEMARDNNSVRFYLGSSSNVIIGEERHKGRTVIETSAEELHNHYWTFCLQKSITARVSQPRFIKLMTELQWSFPFQIVESVGKNNKPQTMYRYITVGE